MARVVGRCNPQGEQPFVVGNPILGAPIHVVCFVVRLIVFAGDSVVSTFFIFDGFVPFLAAAAMLVPHESEVGFF